MHSVRYGKSFNNIISLLNQQMQMILTNQIEKESLE